MTDDFTNELRLKAVAKALDSLAEPFAFVGGAVVSLYAPRDAAPEQRPTDDVGSGRTGQLRGLREAGRAVAGTRFSKRRGFWRHLPVPRSGNYRGRDADGAGNSGFQQPVVSRRFPTRHAEAYALDSETTIRLFTPVYFVASKLEAFKGRGKDDFWGSSDFEDLVYVFDNAPDLGQRLQEGSPAVQAYLREEFIRFLNNPDFEDGILGHVEPRHASARTRRILELLRQFVAP